MVLIYVEFETQVLRASWYGSHFYLFLSIFCNGCVYYLYKKLELYF
jgi:hypothetical protein